MKVLITGAAGLVGTATVQEFLDHDYEVRALDVKPVAVTLRDKVETVYADILDKIALMKAAEGCEAVVHLAALGAMYKTEDRVFNTNVVGTQLALAAAETHGIRRVVLASSNCALGMIYSEGKVLPRYLPVDEHHPLRASDYYGLSKILNEQTAAAFAQRGEMATVCLRLTSILNFNKGPYWLRWMRWQIHNHTGLNYTDLWAYVFVEDAARAFRLAVERPLTGHHVIHIAATDSFTVHDVRDLVRRNIPALAESCGHLEPHQCLYDLAPMREKLGLIDTKCWRDCPEFAELDEEIEPAS